MEENTSKVFIEPAAALRPAADASGVGSPLFVINLCASQAPVQVPGKSLPGLDAYRLYQVSRVEDGRTRYRLRIGFFASEEAANAVLETVRANYATAFTTCLADEDRKFARGYLPDAAPVVRPRPVAVVTRPPAPPVASANVAKAATPATATAPAAVAKPKTTSQAAIAAPSQPAAAKPPVVAKTVPATPAKAPLAPAVPATARAPLTDTQSMKKISIEESAVIELTWEPEAPPQRTLANQTVAEAMAHTTAALAQLSGSHKALDESSIDEIELSWDPPALQAAPAAPAIAPVFKTEPVIKAKQDQKAAQPAASAPVAPAAPAKAAAASKAPAAPSKVATPVATPEIKNPPISLKTSAAVELELESEPAAALATKPPSPSAAEQPFHVGRGAHIPNVSLSLQADAATVAKPAVAAAAATATQAPAKPAAKPAAASKPPVKTPPAARTEPAKKELPAKPAAALATQTRPGAVPLPARVAALPDLDSTQTIRALTNDELNDGAIDKWFAIQLAVSEQPVNLDTMPHLDIFEAYRLYSIANAGSGKIVHSLRLGFFREAVSAEAVAGYLKTFFAATSVMRISSAEHLRFKDAPAPKKPVPVAEPAKDKVVDLNQARDRAARPAIPTVTMEVSPQRSGPIGGTTGTHKVLNPTLKPAAKTAAKTAGPATRRSPPDKSTSATGRYRAPTKMSLQEQLLEEAREVELSESGIRRLPKNHSLLSRLVDKLKK